MAKQWYYMKGQQQFGPISWRELYMAAQAGTVSSSTLVWVQGLREWTPASEIKGLIAQQPAAASTPVPPPVPSAVPVPPIPAPAPPPVPSAVPVPPIPGSTPAPPEPWQPTPTPQVHHAGFQGNDRIVGIIPAMQRKTGMFSVKTYNLVLTEQRIIFAEATAQMLKQAAGDAVAEAKAEGKGFFAQAADTMRSSQRIYHKYWEMAPEAIIAETAGNYAIEHREIASMKIVRQGWIKVGLHHDDQDHRKKDEMLIKTSREKIKLTFEQGKSGEAKKILLGLLGNKVR